MTGLAIKSTTSYLGRMTAVLGVSTALLLSSAGLTPALASTPAVPTVAQTAQMSQSDVPEITPAMLEETYAQLLASDLPREITGFGPAAQTTFTFEQGFELTFGRDYKAAPDKGDQATPLVGGGSDSGGLYVLFNQFDQNLIISGSGFALGTAICFIPAVGQVACVVIGAILTVATTALALNGGTCSNNRQFKVYVTGGVRSGGCV